MEASLGAAVLALIAALAVPWKERPLPSPFAANPSLSRTAPAAAASSARPAAPETVLPLFIGRQAATAAPAAAPAKPPVDAPWLQYLGRSTSPEGVVSVFLKDTKTGRLIRASPGATSDGWTIVQEQEGSIIVKNGDAAYSVVKR